MNAIIETMTIKSKPKNLLEGEGEKTPSNPQKTPQSVEGFLDQMGVDTEKRGKAIYVYADSIETIKKILEKMPNPAENEYVIIPLGSVNGYNVFIMSTIRGVSIRIGYGRNSIPYSTQLSTIIGKLEKVAKEIGIQTPKNTKNLIEA